MSGSWQRLRVGTPPIDNCVCGAKAELHSSRWDDATWVACSKCRLSTIGHHGDYSDVSGIEQVKYWNKMIKEEKRKQYERDLRAGKFLVDW